MDGVDTPARRPATWRDYLALARLDHSTKHVFIVPGAVLAALLRGDRSGQPWQPVLLGLAAAVCVASANYVINEWLDRDFDRFHPVKSCRAAVTTDLRRSVVLAEWAALAAAGLACAALSGALMSATVLLFALQGVAYNVPPLRTKNQAYLDVISEAVNNPLRLTIGWTMVDPTSLPPASVILLYWAGGAFLMAAKRLSEFREIVASHGQALLARYRASFARYTEVSLTVSCFVYALVSSFFLAVFLIKYRIEYLLTMPLFVALFATYLAMAMQPGSSAQAPETLLRERGLVVLVLLLAAVFAVATVVDMPLLDGLTGQRFIGVG